MSFLTMRQLADKTLQYKAPSETDKIRHQTALEQIAHLQKSIHPDHRNGDGITFKIIGDSISNFIGYLGQTTHPDTNFSVLPTDRAFAEGTEVVRILGRIRMCANRTIGATSVTGQAGGWTSQLSMEFRNLELAVASAIAATPIE